MAPKMASKMHSNLHLSFDTVLDRFLADFAPKMAPKLVRIWGPSGVQEGAEEHQANLAKTYKNLRFFKVFGDFGVPR